MEWRLADYALEDADRLLTPALLIYPEMAQANIDATLRMVGGDANRWRPHIKTAKLGATVRQLVDHGVRALKCATTLELLTACECGADDVLLAFPVVGANARRVAEIAERFLRARVSVLVENVEQARTWRGTRVGAFIDVNPGMNRTGLADSDAEGAAAVARELGERFRGLHDYEGHAASFAAEERGARLQSGYDRLLGLVRAIEDAGIAVEEVITSGTPAAGHAAHDQRLRHGRFLHRISPGTVVYNDLTSLEQLPDCGYRPAALVLAAVVSRPTADSVTCDAGTKAVTVDAGIPNCAVIGRPDLRPLKPSEEHLPIQGAADTLPGIGEHLYLLPRHVCPMVNNFDDAVMVRGGRVGGVERVTARGHEAPQTTFSVYSVLR